jgi:hypothetical protein
MTPTELVLGNAALRPVLVIWESAICLVDISSA